MLTRMPQWNGRYLPFGAVGMTVAPVRVKAGRVVPAGRRGLGVDAANVAVQVAPPRDVLKTPWGTTIDCTSFLSFITWPQCSLVPTNWASIQAGTNPNYVGLANPPIPPAPPVPVATASNPNPLVVPPVDQSGAQQTVDQTIAAQGQDWQTQNQQFFADLSQSLNLGCAQNFALSQQLGVCDSTLYWTGGVVAALLLFAFAAGRKGR